MLPFSTVIENGAGAHEKCRDCYCMDGMKTGAWVVRILDLETYAASKYSFSDQSKTDATSLETADNSPRYVDLRIVTSFLTGLTEKH